MTTPKSEHNKETNICESTKLSVNVTASKLREYWKEMATTMERRECSGPAQRFLVHVQLLSRMRDAAHSKMRVDQLKLIQLGNLLNASFESEELREHSDLEVAKMIVNWWKALVESDVASIDRDVKAENVAILRYCMKYCIGDYKC